MIEKLLDAANEAWIKRVGDPKYRDALVFIQAKESDIYFLAASWKLRWIREHGQKFLDEQKSR